MSALHQAFLSHSYERKNTQAFLMPYVMFVEFRQLYDSIIKVYYSHELELLTIATRMSRWCASSGSSSRNTCSKINIRGRLKSTIDEQLVRSAEYRYVLLSFHILNIAHRMTRRHYCFRRMIVKKRVSSQSHVLPLSLGNLSCVESQHTRNSNTFIITLFQSEFPVYNRVV